MNGCYIVVGWDATRAAKPSWGELEGILNSQLLFPSIAVSGSRRKNIQIMAIGLTEWCYFQSNVPVVIAGNAMVLP